MEYLFLNVKRMPRNVLRFLNALYDSAKSIGLDCAMDQHYSPCKVLVLYGLGGADRLPVALSHIERGGMVIAFDLGYWDRDLAKRKFRVSINGFHPTQVMEGKDPPADRWHASGKGVSRKGGDPKGPILLIGNAPKSIAVGAKGWTAEMSRAIRKEFPDKKIRYRPKPKRPAEEGVGYDAISDEPIKEALHRASLVVCRHSNVAVDACMLGVPVVTQDGAAASIYPRTLAAYKDQPDLETRISFLTRLAYWQWNQDEVKLFWKWFITRGSGDED